MKMKKAILPFGLAAATVTMCAGNAVAGVPPKANDFQYYHPVYVHNAVAGGYASEAACKSTLGGVRDRIVASGAHNVSNTGCWKLPSGNWTYGSIAFDYGKKINSLPSSLSGFSVSKFTPTPNVKVHFSGIYESQAQCVAQRNSNISAMQGHKAMVLQTGDCGITGYTLNGSYLWSFGSQAYTSPNNWNLGHDPVGDSPYNAVSLAQ